MKKDYIPFDYARAEMIAKRTKEFYDSNTPKTHIHIKSCRSLKMPKMPALNSFSFPNDMERYLDLRAERDYQFARFHENIQDDFIPSTSPWYGIAEHTAFLGGQVDFTETTTFQHQICAELEDFRNLTLDRNNLWIHLVADGIRYMNEKWSEYIPVRMRGADGPSDIANAVRGSDLFYDIYDEPEMLEELMDFCVKAVHFTTDLQREAATKILDGCINGFGLWMPGKCMGQISEDVSVMLSPDVYEESFLPALKACVDNTDCSMIHVHSLGHRMIPMIAALDKIRLMEISSDPNSPRAVDIFRQYQDVLKDKTVILAPTYKELTEMDDILSNSKVIVWYYAEDEEDIKRVLKLVEKYR
ncbi:MAG: hypothetical protein IJA86_02280 [Clostridia bacterium]|nr:hypothetical protein [Clostridia bacterium]